MSEEVPTAPNTASPAASPPPQRDHSHTSRWIVVAWWLGFGIPLGALLVSLMVLPAWPIPVALGAAAGALATVFGIGRYCGYF